MAAAVRGIRFGLMVFALGGALAGCSDGGNGLFAFFGMNGQGSCRSVTVDVDLNAASAVLIRADDGSLDCVKGTTTANAGCRVTYTENTALNTLHVELSDCRVDPVASLFACGFNSTDLSLLQNATTVTCACSSPGCDKTPPACVAAIELPGACEDCGNDKDDDKNGYTDCDDPNCSHSALCGPVPSTTTTLGETTTTTTPEEPTTTTTLEEPTTTTTLEEPTTTTTTLEEPTTTTTIPSGGAGPYTVLFKLTGASATVGSLQFSTNYSGAPGEFDGLGPAVSCTNKVAGALFAPNDADASNKLTLGLIALTPFAAPTDLVQCNFTATATPTAEDFPVVIEDATDGDGNVITGTIQVVVAPAP